ncbi:hypothetical protein M0P98_00040 [bacterium]|nr:hypothetical protein [bacterium]
MSIIVRKGKVITREELCKAKEKCHKNQAKLSFEEKICILVELQKTSKSARFHKKRLSEKSNQLTFSKP